MDQLVNFLINFFGPTPYLIVLGILLLCGLGLPVPEDIVLFAAGLMSYYYVTNIWIVIAVSLFGVIAGDSIIYYLGSKYGKKLTKKWIFHKLLPDSRLDNAAKLFHSRGPKLLFAARFMPGLRAPIFFSAGTLHIPYKIFLKYNGGAAFLSVPLIIGSVYYFGDQLDKVIRVIQHVENGILFVIAGVVGIFIMKYYFNKRRIKE